MTSDYVECVYLWRDQVLVVSPQYAQFITVVSK